MKKIWFLRVCFGALIAGDLFAQTSVEAERQARALEPIVLRGNVVKFLDVMHPRWQRRLAERVGGEDALRSQYAEQERLLGESGVAILSYTVKKAHDEPLAVNFGREKLVFLPTIKQIEIPHEGKVKRFEQIGYWVAVAAVNTEEWKFIDGATLSRSDLRSLFPELPRDTKLPSVETKAL